MSFCEKNNKRKHGMISKRSKYAEVDSEENDADEDSNDHCELHYIYKDTKNRIGYIIH